MVLALVTTLYPNKFFNIETVGTTTSTTTHIFLGDDMVATVEKKGTTTTTYYHHTDHLSGASVTTGTGGEVAELTDYYPYGNIRLSDSSQGFSEQRKFTGHELDTDTNLTYMGARYYEGSIGRFRSVDPVFLKFDSNTEQGKLMLMDPQLHNSYAYARNNPLVYTDPNGEFIQLPAMAIAGLVGGAIGGLTTALMGGNLQQTGAAILGGAVAGASFSLAGSVGLSQTIGAGMGSNLLGASIARSVAGNDVTPGTLAVDATVGAAGGALGYGAVKGINAFLEASQAATGGKMVYNFLNPQGSSIDTKTAFHILFGNRSGGGHLWPGAPGKTPFPANWSAEKILQTISNISGDTSLLSSEGFRGRAVVQDIVDGVNLKVIRGGPTDTSSTITGFPTNLRRNR